jgi:hypothetical protein
MDSARRGIDHHIFNVILKPIHVYIIGQDRFPSLSLSLSLSLCFPFLQNLLPYSGVLGRGREVPILPPPGFFFFS